MLSNIYLGFAARGKSVENLAQIKVQLVASYQTKVRVLILILARVDTHSENTTVGYDLPAR